MTQHSIELPATVRDLARTVQAGLSDGSAESFRIDAALADFAIRRHKCGPLLFRISQQGAQTDEDAKATLRRHWEQNRRKYIANQLATARLSMAFEPAGIPAIIFKGVPLAQSLYPDPLWRHCGDVDVLIPPASMAGALQILPGVGFHCSEPLLRLPRAIQRIAFGIIRDVALDDTKTRSHIELHSRPLFSKRLSNFVAAHGDAMRPQPVSSKGQFAVAAPDTKLGLYLFFHGCISGWSRLKWLIDLIPLLEKLGPAGRRSLADDAEASGTAAAVKASLQILQAAFGDIDLSPLDSWLGEKSGSAAVQLRARLYAAWLGGDEKDVPMAVRSDILKSSLLLNDRFLDQLKLLTSSGLSSGVRQVARALVRA